MDWMNDANCYGHTKLMFSKAEERAKAKCRDCMVQQACLEFALSNNEQHGVWGGYTADERFKLSSRRLLAKRFPSSQHNNRHEHTHLANAVLSSPVHISNSQHHTPEVLHSQVVLRVVFR